MKPYLIKHKKWLILGALIAILGLSTYFLPKPEIKPEQPVGVVILCIDDITKKLNERIVTCPIAKNEIRNFKSKAIAAIDYSGTYTDSEYGITLEIKDGKVYQNAKGYELYARAWKGADQLGFGKDGTTEWERFIFPIKVGGKYENLTHLVFPDPLGDISVDYQSKDIEGNITIRTAKYREDPKAVLLKILASTIKVSSKDGKNIVKGSIGNTVTTFYPAAGANSPIDGAVRYFGPAGGETWAQVHNATDGTDAYPTDAQVELEIFRSINANLWRMISRFFSLFDTSTIGTDTVDSATLSIWLVSKTTNLSPTGTLSIYTTTPASNSNLVTDDYDQVAAVSQATALNYDDVTAGTYMNFTLNALGLGNINKTGISKFGARNKNYDADNVEPTWAADAIWDLSLATADTADVTNDPKLVVTHNAAAGGEVAPTSPIIIFE